MKDLEIVSWLKRGKKIEIYGEGQPLSFSYKFFHLCDC